MGRGDGMVWGGGDGHQLLLISSFYCIVQNKAPDQS